MSYRCGLCNTHVPHGTPRRVHTVYRNVRYARPLYPRSTPFCHDTITDRPTRREVVREIPVCEGCQVTLDNGISVERLQRALLVAERPQG